MSGNLAITAYEEINTFDKVRETIEKIMNAYKDVLPKKKDSLIFLKPNLNSDMIGLTGNTTDLRIITSLLQYLKKEGYKNVVIGDGTSSGFLNNNINVFKRLGIEKLAEIYGARTMDLNKAPYKGKDIGCKKVKIAKICFDADFFINLPKIKTHAEAGFSCALKNMIGCVIGLDKQKIHESLVENIIRLNEVIKPDLHIVDGLVGMEGYGPSRGVPRRLDTLVVSKNPYLIDFFCTKLIGLDYRDVGYLKLADEKGYFSSEDYNKLKTKSQEFEKPNINKFTKLAIKITNSPVREYIVKIRYHKIFNTLFASKILSSILLSSGLRQDVFNQRDKRIDYLYINKQECTKCGECFKYCPVGIDPSKKDKIKDCIKCMYCYFICPENAIHIDGETGYLSYQIDNYKKHIQNLTRARSEIQRND